MAALALGAMLNPINSTTLSMALLPIAESLRASVAETGWLIAGLYLTTAIAPPIMGQLVHLFGPRRIFLMSLFFVAVAGVFGQKASSLTGLVIVRVLFGIGTSAAYPAAMRIFRVQAERTGSKPPCLAVLPLAAISTTAAGPLIGGVLTSAFGWHSIFTVNLPLALLTALLILLWTPKDQPRTQSFARSFEGVDLTGIKLFTIFLVSLMAFLMKLKDRPLRLALLSAAVFGGALIIHSLRRTQPFIDVRMLASNRPLTATYLRAAGS
jgi:MFS family permease